MVETGWTIMGIEMNKVESHGVASTAAPASAPVPAKTPENAENNTDAVKVTLAAIENNDEQAKAKQEQMLVQQEERERRFKEQADKNFAKTSVEFLARDGDAPVDLKFRVVESESGRVLVEYPPDVAIKKMEKAMDEQEGPGQVIDKAV